MAFCAPARPTGKACIALSAIPLAASTPTARPSARNKPPVAPPACGELPLAGGTGGELVAGGDPNGPSLLSLGCVAAGRAAGVVESLAGLAAPNGLPPALAPLAGDD